MCCIESYQHKYASSTDTFTPENSAKSPQKNSELGFFRIATQITELYVMDSYYSVYWSSHAVRIVFATEKLKRFMLSLDCIRKYT